MEKYCWIVNRPDFIRLIILIINFSWWSSLSFHRGKNDVFTVIGKLDHRRIRLEDLFNILYIQSFYVVQQHTSFFERFCITIIFNQAWPWWMALRVQDCMHCFRFHRVVTSSFIEHENISRLIRAISITNEKELIQSCFINLKYLSHYWHRDHEMVIAPVIGVNSFVPETYQSDSFCIDSLLII